MPMRLELGALTLVVERQEDAAAFLRGLLRHLNNLELAELLGVTDKTVRRWKREGRLPRREGGQVMLLELLQHVQARAQPSSAPMAPTRRAGRSKELAKKDGTPPAETDADPRAGVLATEDGQSKVATRARLRSRRRTLPDARRFVPGSGP